MITSAIFTVLLAILVGLLFYSSYLWDKVSALEDELDMIRGRSNGKA